MTNVLISRQVKGFFCFVCFVLILLCIKQKSKITVKSRMDISSLEHL